MRRRDSGIPPAKSADHMWVNQCLVRVVRRRIELFIDIGFFMEWKGRSQSAIDWIRDPALARLYLGEGQFFVLMPLTERPGSATKIHLGQPSLSGRQGATGPFCSAWADALPHPVSSWNWSMEWSRTPVRPRMISHHREEKSQYWN
jgi:hypothetical protein